MASTYSPSLKIELMGTGDQTGTWGTTTNNNFLYALEEGLLGYINISFASDANKTLTLSDSNAAQDARNLYLYVTSGVSLTATRDLIVPTTEKPYIVHNATTGSQSIRVKTAAGTGITIPNGKKALLYADGTNVVEQVSYVGALTIGSVTLSTALPVASGGTGATDAGTARTNLGLAIGTNVQAYDAGLQSIAGLTTSADKMIYTTASDTYAVTALTSYARTLLDDASASTARTTLGLGTSATVNTGTSGATIPLLNGANTYSGASTFSAAVQISSLGVGTAASGTTGEIRATNNITAYYSSDSRLKENVVRISDPMGKISAINGYMFDWTDDYVTANGGEDGYFVRKHDTGVIAQEIEQIMPECVATRDDGYMAVKYDRLVPLLIEAVKDLQRQIDELRNP